MGRGRGAGDIAPRSTCARARARGDASRADPADGGYGARSLKNAVHTPPHRQSPSRRCVLPAVAQNDRTAGIRTLKFTKMQGTGNDFLFVESRDEREHDWEALSRGICDRHYGAGANGLMVVLPSERADVRMRLFNADGSEAEVSGNGVRCLVKYAIERSLATPTDGRLRIEAVHGVLEAEASMKDGKVTGVRLSMGPPRFAPNEVPVIAEMEPVIDFPLEVDGERLDVTCLSMGNPHAVLFVAQPVERYPLEM